MAALNYAQWTIDPGSYESDFLMSDRRKTDSDAYTRFRPSRFVKEGGKWYFSTREGTMEGPFELKPDAEDRLNSYIKIMASGFMPRDSKLSIQPFNVPKL